MKTVTPKDFGRDHNAMIAYLETLQVDSTTPGVAMLDKRRMRTNPRRHPMQAVNMNDNRACSGWKASYGSRLAGSFVKGKIRPDRVLGPHDDWDCLEDLEAAGMVEILSLANGYVRFTDKGLKVAEDIRLWKAKGGQFADFRHQDSMALHA